MQELALGVVAFVAVLSVFALLVVCKGQAEASDKVLDRLLAHSEDQRQYVYNCRELEIRRMEAMANLGPPNPANAVPRREPTEPPPDLVVSMNENGDRIS